MDRLFFRRKPGDLLKAPSVKEQVLAFVFCYTVLFLGISFFVLYPFLEYNRTLIWKIDGMPQYLLWLQYTGEYLQNALHGLLNGSLVLPKYDFEIGMGGDVNTFLKSEPMVLFGIFLTPKISAWKFYTILSVIRLYLPGLSFGAYGFYRKYSFFPVLTASLFYTFTGFAFYQVERHPQFALPIILLPLLFIGLEQVITRKGYLFYALMVAVSFFGSYYFLYINTVFMGIYALLRLGQVYPANRIREFFCMLGRIIASYLLGCAMSVYVASPAIARFFLSSRSSSEGKDSMLGNLWTYGAGRLESLFLSLIGPVRSVDALTTITVAALIIPALVLLFSGRNKEKRSLRLAVLLGVLFLMIPMVGFVLSGFGNIGNRWCYGFLFALALVLLTEFENLKRLSARQFIALGLLTVLYALVWLWYKPGAIAYLSGLLLLLLTGLLLLLIRFCFNAEKPLWKVLVCLFLCGNLALNGFLINDRDFGNLVSEFQPMKSADEYFEESRYRYAAAIDDPEFARIDTNMMENNYNNTSVALGFNGISLYNSTIGSVTIDYFVESESTGISAVNRTLFMDGRTVQEALACVKYFFTTKDGSRYVPYSYELDPSLTEGSKTYDIYVNQYPLSIGYSYDAVMARSDYEALTALEKQQAQLQYAVVEDEELPHLPLTAESMPDAGITEGVVTQTAIDDGLLQGEGYTYTFDQLKNGDEPLCVTFSTESKAGCEVYLRLKDTDCSRKIRTDIYIDTGEIRKRAIVRDESDTYRVDRDDYLICLGYYDTAEPIDFTLTVDETGIYTIGDLEIYYVPMAGYEDAIASLADGSLEEVVIENDTVSGRVLLSSPELLTFSIPYNVGWKAMVDGKETELMKVNTMYMGLLLEEGEHTVELRYTSPGSSVGAAVSLAAIALYLVLLTVSLIKRKKR